MRCYVTSADRRREVAARLSRETGVEVLAVEHPREAVEGCAIVTTATSSGQPVFEAAWLRPGQHVNTMLGCDWFARRQEIEDEVVRLADVVVVNSKRQAVVDDQPEIMNSIRKGYVTWDKIFDVGELLTGKLHGRTNEYQLTLHDNNAGMGIQFAAAGARLVEKARAAGRGTKLPVDLFMTRRGEGVYAP